jgi:hypothetical protein
MKSIIVGNENDAGNNFLHILIITVKYAIWFVNTRAGSDNAARKIFKMPRRGLFKLSDNENILTCEVNTIVNEIQVNKNSERRFALTIQVHELVKDNN